METADVEPWSRAYNFRKENILNKSKSRGYVFFFFPKKLLCAQSKPTGKQNFTVNSCSQCLCLSHSPVGTKIHHMPAAKINWYYNVLQHICKMETSTAKHML